jgi:translation initiation factor 2 alpha subunit (eIF-2alpha)
MSFEVKHNGAVVIVEEYDEKSGEIAIEDVVNPDTGEVLTDDWFESGDIYEQELRDKIKDYQNDQKIDDFIDQL